MQIRSIHRIVTFFVVIFTLYLGVTGALIQLTDFHSLLAHVPAHDPNMEAIREDFNGPEDYAVLSTDDYDAATLPANADLNAMMANVIKGARATLHTAPISFVELRVLGGQPVGQVGSADKLLRLDPSNGTTLAQTTIVRQRGEPPLSLRNFFKHIHRMTPFGNWALWINVVVSVGLATLIVTGTIMYVKMLIGRAQLNRKNLFWIAGGWWKTLHRAVALVCAVWLVVVVVSGAWLAYESLVLGYYLAAKTAAPTPPRVDDAASPLDDAAPPAMLQTTLRAYNALMPGVPPRVVRLRIYGGMPQGAVVSGGDATQFVFNTNTGKQVSETEPGYPDTGFPFGWQAHQWAKQIHRGSFFGFTGRVADLIAGFAMIYLSISGMVMYYELWQKRRRQGRKAWIWS